MKRRYWLRHTKSSNILPLPLIFDLPKSVLKIAWCSIPGKLMELAKKFSKALENCTTGGVDYYGTLRQIQIKNYNIYFPLATRFGILLSLVYISDFKMQWSTDRKRNVNHLWRICVLPSRFTVVKFHSLFTSREREFLFRISFLKIEIY